MIIMLLATLDTISGYHIEPIGLIMDTETIGLHVGRDILIRITDLIGGRSRVIDKQSQAALESAATRISERAKQLGADAVLGVRLIIQPIGVKRTAMVQAVIYGTAVRLRPLSS